MSPASSSRAAGDGPGRVAISEVRFTSASPRDRARGLLGFVRCRMGGLRLDGITLRRTRDGRRALSFPHRRDRSGHERPYYSPADDETRREIQRQVFLALGLEVAE